MRRLSINPVSRRNERSPVHVRGSAGTAMPYGVRMSYSIGAVVVGSSLVGCSCVVMLTFIGVGFTRRFAR